MNQKHVIFLIDSSYSMNPYMNSILKNLNTFVKMNKYTKNLFLSVISFSMELKFIVKLQNISEVEEFNVNHFEMGGLTRLYDSICDVLVTFEMYKENCNQHLLIISDGVDNSSWRFNKDTMNKICDDRKKYNWIITNYNTNVIENLSIPTILFDIDNEDDISNIFENLKL